MVYRKTHFGAKNAHLSWGASLSSHFTTAASACKLTSTNVGFFSSAIAFTSSPTCGLYRAGQCLEIYVNTVCAWWADDCPWLFLLPSPFCTRFTRVGIDDWLTMRRLARRRRIVIVDRTAGDDCSTRRRNSFWQIYMSVKSC
jgi:hypothetical protein